jgi:thioesterase domain-containing protein
MVPSAFIWLDRIPQTSSGKIDRRALPAPGPKILTAAVAAPRDALEDTLIRIWEEILSRGPIGVHDDFFDLGGHSLLAVRLFDRIWRETGQRIPLSALLEGATVGQLAGRIREEKAATRNGLVPVQPAGTRRPLFVVPGVGSQILYLRNLAIHFGLDQPIYALHQSATGPGDRTERPIEELADEYVAALRSVQAQGPYDLVGFSFGGPVAYEIAQQLIADGETVGLLCLIDSRHPQQMRPSGFQPRFVARRFANQLRIVRRLGLRTGARYLRRRLWIARINSIAEARRLLRAGLPGLFARTLRDPAADVERAWVAADMRAYNGYRPKPYPGPITFLWAEHSQHPSAVFDTRRGWAELALGGFDARPIPGSHLTVLVEPLARITTAVLAEALGEARGRAEGRDSRDEPGTSGGTAGPAAGH